MMAATARAAANPRPRQRPARYAIAAGVAVVLVIVLGLSSVLNYAYLDTIPGRVSLYGLVAVALIALATYIGVRAFDRNEVDRTRHLIRAGVLLGLAVVLWLLLLDAFIYLGSAGPVVAAASAFACVPTTAFGLLVVRRLDRNEKEPWRLVLVATAWGAVVATTVVIWGESLWEGLASRTLVPGPGLEASIAFSAGVLEELAKGIAVLLLFLVMRDEFDDVVDGIVYGAAIGLGFNFMESIAYMTTFYAIYSPEGVGGLAAGFQWYGRQVLGLFFGHATYTALAGAGIGIARQLPGLRQKVVAIGSGFLVAVAAHFSWDAWLEFFPVERSDFGLIEVQLRTLVMSGPFTAAVIALLVLGMRNQSQALLDQFRKEAAEGHGAILAEEVGILVSPRQRARQRLGALKRGGVSAYLSLAHLQNAQIDLALERWHRERKESEAPLEAEQALRQHAIELRKKTNG